MEKKSLIEAGRIVNTHGVQGEVKIEIWLDSPRFFKSFRRLVLPDGGRPQGSPLRGEGGSPRSPARGETDEVSAPRFVQRFAGTGLPPHPPFGHLPLQGKAMPTAPLLLKVS